MAFNDFRGIAASQHVLVAVLPQKIKQNISKQINPNIKKYQKYKQPNNIIFKWYVSMVLNGINDILMLFNDI